MSIHVDMQAPHPCQTGLAGGHLPQPVVYVGPAQSAAADAMWGGVIVDQQVSEEVCGQRMIGRGRRCPEGGVSGAYFFGYVWVAGEPGLVGCEPGVVCV